MFNMLQSFIQGHNLPLKFGGPFLARDAPWSIFPAPFPVLG